MNIRLRCPRSLVLIMLSLSLLIVASVCVSAEEGLILHRVFVSPIETETAEGEVTELPAVYREAPEMLYELITTLQPVVRVANPENAHSSIVCEAKPHASEGEHDSLDIVFGIERQGMRIAEEERQLSLPPTHERYIDTLEGVAEIFASDLGKMDPKIVLSEIETDRETEAVLDQILFEAANATSFEAGLWIGIASKNIGSDENADIHFTFPLHYVAELSWFPSEHHGITGNFLFTRNDMYSQGNDPTSDDDDAATMNSLFMPGIGYTFRTLGRIAGGLFLGYSAGLLQVEALEPADIGGGEILQEGATETAFAHFFTIRPVLSYSITPNWSVKSSVVFFLDPALFSGGDTQFNVSDLQVLNFAVSYGWK